MRDFAPNINLRAPQALLQVRQLLSVPISPHLPLVRRLFGSLVNPTTRSALYTIKPTLGLFPSSGIIPISKRYDTPGPMAKSVKDVANLRTALVDPEKTDVPLGGYTPVLSGGWGEIRFGTLDPEKWDFEKCDRQTRC